MNSPSKLDSPGEEALEHRDERTNWKLCQNAFYAFYRAHRSACYDRYSAWARMIAAPDSGDEAKSAHALRKLTGARIDFRFDGSSLKTESCTLLRILEFLRTFWRRRRKRRKRKITILLKDSILDNVCITWITLEESFT